MNPLRITRHTRGPSVVELIHISIGGGGGGASSKNRPSAFTRGRAFVRIIAVRTVYKRSFHSCFHGIKVISVPREYYHKFIFS